MNYQSLLSSFIVRSAFSSLVQGQDLTCVGVTAGLQPVPLTIDNPARFFKCPGGSTSDHLEPGPTSDEGLEPPPAVYKTRSPLSYAAITVEFCRHPQNSDTNHTFTKRAARCNPATAAFTLSDKIC